MIPIPLPDRYKFSGNVASGGMGSVIFCQDTHLDRPVAIKVIYDTTSLNRLVDELSALMLMRSKHVVQIYDIIYDRTTPAGIVVEFVSGEDLISSSSPQSSIDQYLKTLWQIASGISDIHSAGVIHRDIKPNNMMIDHEGVLKIFDFGLARESDVNAETIGFKGTFNFAAPELFTNSKVTFTKAIDVYAFGAVACYLADKIMPAELAETPPTNVPSSLFSSKPLNIPLELSSLLLSCLSVNPAGRPHISKVRNIISQYLLKNKHQAIVVYNKEINYLNETNKKVALKYGSIGDIAIEYDGFRFLVVSANGEVAMNNIPVAAGDEIPGSCVVVFGGKNRPNRDRGFITFDISHPEMVL